MSPFLGGEAAAALDALAALQSVEEQPAPLTRLRGIRTLLTALDADSAALEAVRAALAAGASWAEIADASGLSPAAARQRWAGDDDEIAQRQEASRRRKRERPSSKPSDLPGLSVAEAAEQYGVSVQAIYQRVTRGLLRAETVELPDGRKYKRVFPEEPAASAATTPAESPAES